MGKMACLTGLVSGVVALLCWIIMFLAGTDIWHDTGRPDIWNLEGPPYPDVRAFLWAYYLLFPVLMAQMTCSWMGFMAARKRQNHLPR